MNCKKIFTRRLQYIYSCKW